MTLCSGCPRSYHYQCLDKDTKARARAKFNFYCSQHQCADCLQKTGDAGGMIFRCRWCERGYCEDCLDFEKAELIGENLKEYELLGFPPITQAYYIRCHECCDHHAESPEARKFIENISAQVDAQYQEVLDQRAGLAEENDSDKVKMPESRAESMTDATTLDDSGISTPQVGALETCVSTDSKKRAAPQTFKDTLTKRSRRLLSLP